MPKGDEPKEVVFEHVFFFPGGLVKITNLILLNYHQRISTMKNKSLGPLTTPSASNALSVLESTWPWAFGGGTVTLSFVCLELQYYTILHQ